MGWKPPDIWSGGFCLPECALAYAMAHFEAFRVLKVREERLDEMPLFGRHNDHAWFCAKSGKRLKFAELRPVAHLVLDGSQIEGQRPCVLRRQSYGGEEVGDLEFVAGVLDDAVLSIIRVARSFTCGEAEA